MQYTVEQLNEMMANNNGDLDLCGQNITSLPEGLVVKGYLDLSYTPLTSLPTNFHVEGSLYLNGTKITSLPEGLVVGETLAVSDTPLTSLPTNFHVGGSLYLSRTKITSLPEGLVVGETLHALQTPLTSLPTNFHVGGSLNLKGTKITSLPEGLVVGGSLDVSDTSLTSLPKDLYVAGLLDLCKTNLTSLPEGLKVGRTLCLQNTAVIILPKNLKANDVDAENGQLTNPNDYTKWKEGDYKENAYLYVDGMLTFIKRKRPIGSYTFYQGRFKGRHVVTDGTHYAHCQTLKEGIRDLAYKQAKNRGVEAYEHLTLENILTVQEAITMYRVITGACQAGVDQFVASLGKTKDTYAVSEILALTKGHYGHQTFQGFFYQTA